MTRQLQTCNPEIKIVTVSTGKGILFYFTRSTPNSTVQSHHLSMSHTTTGMHQARKYTHKSSGSYSQGNFCNCVHQLLLNPTGTTGINLKVLQACQRTRNDDETGQQDPVEEQGEQSIHDWDSIDC